MKTFGITVTAKLKHAAIWAAAKKCGGQSALAKILGVPRRDVYDWCGLRRVPGKRFLDDIGFQQKLFDLTGQTVDDLFPPELRDAADFLKSPKSIEQTQEFDLLRIADTYSERLTLPHPEVAAQQLETKERIRSVINTLSFREKEIIKLRYGLEDGHSYTLEEVSQIFKVGRERIRQIEAKAMRKLQQPSRSKELVECL